MIKESLLRNIKMFKTLLKSKSREEKKMKLQGGYNNSCREIEFIKILKNLKTTF